MIVSVGAILSILAFWIAPHSSERDIIYEVVNAFFCVFAVLFPELLLPLIFGIKNDQHQNLSADVKGEHTNY